MALELGVDFSEHGGDLSTTTAQRWESAGVRFAIVQYSHRLPQHLSVLAVTSWDIQAYVYLYFPLSPWQQTPEDRVQACIDMIRRSPVANRVIQIWLDVEVEGWPQDTPGNTIAALLRCANLCVSQGFQPGVYTSSSMWEKMCANSTSLSHLPLWDAFHINLHPAPHTELGLAGYGGWGKPQIWQYHNTINFEGHEVDLNLREVGGVVPIPQPIPWSREAAIDAASLVVHYLNKGWNLSDLKDYAQVVEETAHRMRGEV